MSPRVLVVTSIVPWPANTGGRLRTAQLVRTLSTTYDVTVAAFTYPPESYASPPAGVELVQVEYEQPALLADLESEDDDVRLAAADRLSAAAHEPWLASYYDVPTMSETLRRLGGSWRAVLVEGTHMARFLPDLPAAGRVLDLMDVCAAIYERRASESRAIGDRLEFERVRRFESAAAAACDAVVSVSVDEQMRAHRLLGVHSTVVPNGVDCAQMAAPGAAHECTGPCLLFVGSMSYQPNVEAAVWLRDDVLPLILADRPDAHAHVVGRFPPPELLASDSEGFRVHGEVPDVRPYYRACDVVAVPVLSGGGSRLKVIEAAAAGRPIVSTPLGAEGFGAVDGRDVLLAATAEDFAAHVLALLEDRGRRTALADAARRLAMSFEWQRVGAQLLDIVGSL